jgi:hypothetical protein
MERNAATATLSQGEAWPAKQHYELEEHRVQIIALFDDDSIAKKILLAMMEGPTGEGLLELSGLTPTEYESKRKKIADALKQEIKTNEHKPQRAS